MRPTLLLLGVLATHAYCRSLGSVKRADPTFVDRALVRRTNPYFHSGDYGNNDDGESKRELLEDGVKDVYELVSTALTHWSDDIFDRWFPGGKDKIINALLAIVPSPVLQPGIGGDDLALFQISPVDFLEGQGDNDLCAQNADAYTANRETNYPGGETEEYSLSYFCPVAFDLDEPMRLSDLDCEEDFKFSNGRYRVTNMMDTLGATILHEMIRFNAIGSKTGLTQKDNNGALVSDIAGDDTVGDVGDPYASWSLRQSSDAETDLCILNADNYVWLVLELYWTHKCSSKLKDQNGRFDPPQA